MRKFIMFTAVCILSLIKLRWPMNKSLYKICSFLKDKRAKIVALLILVATRRGRWEGREGDLKGVQLKFVI